MHRRHRSALRIVAAAMLLVGIVCAAAASGDVLTNVFEGAGFAVPGAVAASEVQGLVPTAFNVYTIWCRSDRIQWFVNGDLVRQEFLVLPQAPLRVRLNHWAPDPAFALAYSAALHRTRTRASSTRWIACA
ncbi:MAG: hypothetical protein E4H11_08420 [Myxococcales bacterium]|nr:MAG: hypothetical protein E4H11_08420 [Myxococcales bacterium]